VLKTQPLIKATGFSLIELMMGIAILSIVMGMGMPSYSVWIQNMRLRNAAESILSGLQLARAEAVRRNTPVDFRLESGSSWTVGCPPPGTANCPPTIQNRPTGDGSSAAVTVASAAGTTFTFNSLGRRTVPLPAAGASTAINVDINPAVLSAAQSHDLRITVDIGGNIRMCDPNVPVTVPPDSRAC
jgi:type IV fimbrial biogenesis protein FimT